MDKLAKVDCRYLTETRVVAIEQSDGRLNIRVKRYNMDDVLTGFDTVVLAMGVAPNNALGLALQERFSNVHLIGDCAGPGDYRKAVHDAAAVALEI
jgi:pyruvate/2-oxoglutarate dehydrogenase complex dihydrolipoamide dehydrogenase (E3) component